MLLAIISDSHDNLATLAKFFDFAKKNGINDLIHCGDVAAGETLDYIVSRAHGRVYVCEGNMDYGHQLQEAAAKFPEKISYFKNFGQAKIDGLNIGFCHHKETAASQCKNGKFDFVFYGHTHKPWLQSVGACFLANPGNLSGTFYKATFAILDTKTKNLSLKIVDRL
jgi:putative phosphoesterase